MNRLHQATIVIGDQGISGTTGDFDAAQTDDEAELIIISDQQVDSVNIIYLTLTLEGGTDVSDYSSNSANRSQNHSGVVGQFAGYQTVSGLSVLVRQWRVVSQRMRSLFGR